MPGTASISGVVSGMQTDEIIAKIMQLERAPITRLEAQKASLTVKLTAWQDFNTRVLALKVKADVLATGSAFQSRTFTTSDSDILTGSAGSDAQVGTYFLKVTRLARTHQVAATGFADTGSTRVGTGTISIAAGTGAAKTITIDDSNNTLAGVRDAINRADAGVTATIVNDGSGTPYRLILTSNTSGTAGAMAISTSLSGGTGIAFDTADPLQAAQDALITLGEGASAIEVTKGSNQVTNLIPGVTLNLLEADLNKTVSIKVEADTASTRQAIQDFVTQYNNLIDFMNQQFSYDAELNKAGTLFGDFSLLSIQTDLRSKVSNPVTGLAQATRVLSQIGITSTSTDKLTINETYLNKALSDTPAEVKRLFATLGEPSSSYVSYVSASSKTKVSLSTGYSVQVTTPATQTRVTMGASQTSTLGQNETIVVNGTVIHLASGMSQSDVISRINEYTAETGVVASATGADGSGTGNYLTLQRSSYGSGYGITVSSDVSNGGGTPASNTSGIGTTTVTEQSPAGQTGTGTGAAGTDVAGTISGETATGKGQYLTGVEGNANTEGLKLRITATVAGSYGAVTFTKGIAGILSDYVDSITQPTNGTVMSAQDTLQSKIGYIKDEISEMEKRLIAKEDRLIAQFSAMESALNNLQNQGSFLTSQLSQASKNWK